MKVLIVTDSLSIGGKERQINEFVQFISRKSNYSVRIVTKNRIALEGEMAQVSLEIIQPEKRLNLFHFFGFVYHQISQFEPDIVHTWEGGAGLCVSILKFSRLIKFKLVDGTIRYAKKYNRSSKVYWINKINHSIADRVVANSFAGKNSLSHGNWKKVVVIPNGFDFARFSAYLKKPVSNKSSICIGMIANFTLPKDYQTFILAALHLLQYGHKITIICIGDGPEQTGIQHLIPAELQTYFTFTGRISKPEEFLSQFDIGVLLNKKNHSEGMSNAIMEYMIFGLPVICTNTGGNPELVQENSNGFLIEPENLDEMIQKLTLLITDDKLRASFGNTSKNIALQNFDIAKTSEQYIMLYENLVRK